MTEHREGTKRIYAIAPRGVADLRSYFDGLWSLALDSFKAAAEKESATSSEAEC